MSEDNLVEVGPDGVLTDIAAALEMACSSGFNADEAVGVVSNVCARCGTQSLGHSNVILMDINDDGHQYRCFSCYSDKRKDDPEDTRAWRKRDGDWGDQELPKHPWKRDRGTTKLAHISRYRGIIRRP